MKEIKFQTTKNRQRRAYYYSRPQMRWFPMPLAEAELLVSAGQARDLTGIEAMGDRCPAGTLRLAN